MYKDNMKMYRHDRKKLDGDYPQIGIPQNELKQDIKLKRNPFTLSNCFKDNI